MKPTIRLLPVALALACCATVASAQTSTRATNTSAIPFTQQGYVGLNMGQSKYSLNSGTGGFGVDDSGTAAKLYAGGYFHPNVGLEFGYLNFGNAERLGGKTKAQGLNLSLGVRWAFNPQWAAVLEWERHRLHFADGKSNTNMTTLGVQYRY